MAYTQRAGGADDDRQRDPGFYLIGKGRRAIERTIDYRAPRMRRLLRTYVAAGRPPGILATIAVLSGVVFTLPLLSPPAHPASAVSLLISHCWPQSRLGPGIALSESKRHAFVARPCTSARVARRRAATSCGPCRRADALDRRRRSRGANRAARSALLANPNGDLRFAVLSDWMDAPTEVMPGDDETLERHVRESPA